MPEKKGTPEKVKVNHFTHSSCRMHLLPLYSPSIPLQCHRYWGACAPHFLESSLRTFRGSKMFLAMPCIVNIRYQRFYRVKDNFLWVLGWWSCVSHIKQRVSSRAVNCVDHKPLPLQPEFSKLTSADDSFCLGLTSLVILFMLSKTKQKTD